MSSPTHEEKRRILRRHFLLGKLSPNEIDALISYARVEEVRAAQQRKPQPAPPNPAPGSLEWQALQNSRNGSS